MRNTCFTVTFQASSNKLWFGRDFFGRQSLLFHKGDDSLALSSCVMSNMTSFSELPALGLYCCDFESNGSIGELVLYPWDCMKDSIDLETVKCTTSHLVIQSPVMFHLFNEKSELSVEIKCDGDLFDILLSDRPTDRKTDPDTRS